MDRLEERDWAEHWTIDPGIVFLNHGSFGATPIAVLEAQDRYRRRMEREPVRFFVRELEPLLDSARSEVASFVDADPEGLAFAPNSTTAINGVLRSLRLSPGDELLTTNHEYNAIRNALEFVADGVGATVVVVEIPFPIEDPSLVISRLLERVTARTRVAVVDHVSSQTALVLPVEDIVREMSGRGVETLVDGSHAPGMLPLSIRSVGAAWYAANLHKHVCAPKGAGFLWTREDLRGDVRPAVISHGANSTRMDRSRYLIEFDWTGTFDPSAWLASAEAIRYVGSLMSGGWTAIMDRNHHLALFARDLMCETLDIDKPAPDSMLGTMAAFPLPDGSPDFAPPSLYGDPLQDALLEHHSIEIPVIAWPQPPARVMRLSAHLHNRAEDYRMLARALRAELDREAAGASPAAE